jgi:hypothetical protein
MADGSAPELHDLTTDEGEKHNLAADHPDRAAAMKKRLLDWNATMPKDRPAPPRISAPNAPAKVDGQ